MADQRGTIGPASTIVVIQIDHDVAIRAYAIPNTIRPTVISPP